MLDTIAEEAPVQANRVLACVRKIYNWALSQDLVEHNPCIGISEPAKEKPRDRILNDDEIRAVWNAASGEKLPMAAYLKLLFLTMKREGETSSMRWRDIDWERKAWTLPAETTKSGEPDAVPLSPAAVWVLKELLKHADREAKKHNRKIPEWVFPDRRNRTEHMNDVQKFMSRVRENAKVDGNQIPHWTGHDLRRTGRSYMGRLSVPTHISELLLGHKMPGIVAVYDRYDYLEEKREALDAWGRELMRIVSGLKDVAERKA